MPAYMIASVKVTDDSWIPEYAENVHDIAHKHGGKYLSRSGNITLLEGEEPDIDAVALLEFPTVEAAQAFVNDPDYAPYAESRRAGTVSNFYAIDDVDLMQSIPYLPKE